MLNQKCESKQCWKKIHSSQSSWSGSSREYESEFVFCFVSVIFVFWGRFRRLDALFALYVPVPIWRLPLFQYSMRDPRRKLKYLMNDYCSRAGHRVLWCVHIPPLINVWRCLPRDWRLFLQGRRWMVGTILICIHGGNCWVQITKSKFAWGAVVCWLWKHFASSPADCKIRQECNVRQAGGVNGNKVKTDS